MYFKEKTYVAFDQIYFVSLKMAAKGEGKYAKRKREKSQREENHSIG